MTFYPGVHIDVKILRDYFYHSLLRISATYFINPQLHIRSRCCWQIFGLIPVLLLHNTLENVFTLLPIKTLDSRTESVQLIKTEDFQFVKMEAVQLVKAEAFQVVKTKAVQLVKMEAVQVVKTEDFQVVKKEVFQLVKTEGVKVVKTEVFKWKNVCSPSLLQSEWKIFSWKPFKPRSAAYISVFPCCDNKRRGRTFSYSESQGFVY